MRHPDGQFSEVWKIKPIFQTFFKGFYTGKIRLNHRDIIRVGGHAHQAAEANIGKISGKDCLYLVLSEATFCLLSSKMKFEKDIDNSIVICPPALDGFQETQRINGLHKRRIRQDHLQFVGLEMAYKMPLDVGRQNLDFSGELLRTVLPETTLTGIIGG